jgi:hypothetical protein
VVIGRRPDRWRTGRWPRSALSREVSGLHGPKMSMTSLLSTELDDLHRRRAVPPVEPADRTPVQGRPGARRCRANQCGGSWPRVLILIGIFTCCRVAPLLRDRVEATVQGGTPSAFLPGVLPPPPDRPTDRPLALERPSSEAAPILLYAPHETGCVTTCED